MIRIVLVMLAMVLGLTILRVILSSIVRLIRSFINPKSNQQPMPRQPSGEPGEPAAQLLRRCAHCGTFTPESAAKRGSGSGEVYFCSAECQGKAAVKA